MKTLKSAESPVGDRVAKILLVEDDRDVRKSIKLQLEEEGHEVTETESGSEALALAKSSAFDIVLTDVMLPDTNGIELVQRMSHLSSCPVTVVMTGFGSVEMAVNAIKAGAFDFLSKPFSFDVLSATVASALRVKSLQYRTTHYFIWTGHRNNLGASDDTHNPCYPISQKRSKGRKGFSSMIFTLI